jgi:hypothetical protein
VAANVGKRQNLEVIAQYLPDFVQLMLVVRCENDSLHHSFITYNL